MSTDYHTAQGDFSSIVYRLQPMVLSNFVMWLDLKVAEFKVYGQMLLDEQDTNCSKWFLRTGLGQDVPPHAKQKERTSNVHVGTTERPKRSSTSVVSKPAKQTRIDISDEEENIEFKTKSILPLEASGMLEEFNQFQEQMNSFISSAANQAVQNSSPATQLFGRTKTLPSRQSPIQQQEKKHSEHDVPKHIVVKKTLSPVFDIIQSHSADSSLSSDLSNLSRPTSEASSQRPLPVLSQTSQFETPHSQQLPTAVSSSTILPQSDSKPVVKVEPTDSEYDESAMDRIAPFSEMSSENTPSSMYLVPNVAMTGDTNSNVSGQTRTVTHSDGIMYFSTQSDSEALQTDDKSDVISRRPSMERNTCWPVDQSPGFGGSSGERKSIFNMPTSSFAVTDSSIDYRCPQCENSYNDIDILLDHISRCFGINKFTCYLCYRRFNGTRDLKDHLSAKHFKLNAYRCHCGRAFKWRRTFIKHRKNCYISAAEEQLQS